MKCSKAYCETEAVRRMGNGSYCLRHYRFSHMRRRARKDGKTVPTYAELESLVPDPFACSVCKRRMNWLSSEGTSTVVTLQHDRSGGHRLLCLACNTRHAALPGDSLYDIPPDMRRCPACRKLKHLDAFCMDASRFAGRKTYCRPCSSARHRAWRQRGAA